MNEELRAHVTRVGFDLTLGKTHIAALVWLEELRAVGWDAGKLADTRISNNRQAHRLGFSHFVIGMRGLEDRGLLTHDVQTREQQIAWSRKHPVRRLDNGSLTVPHNPRVWKLTKAGRAVVSLLKESGIYDEYADVLRPVDEQMTA